MNLSDMGGRKFFYALLIAVLGYAAMMFGKMTPQEWNSLVVWAFGIFSVANVASNISDAMTTKMESPDKDAK